MSINQIKNNFDKASITYEEVASVQKESAQLLTQKLVQIMNNKTPKTVLDLGTGTGYMIEFLLEHYLNSQYTLNDISEKMLSICKSKFSSYNNMSFLNCNINDIQLNNYDLIVSNFALQWLDRIWHIIYKSQLKSDIFAFTTLLDGTFIEWETILMDCLQYNIKNNYPNAESLRNYCRSVKNFNKKFHCQTKDFVLEFKDCITFMQYLKKLGASFSSKRTYYSQTLNLIKRNKNPIKITYRVFFGIFYTT